MATVQIKEPDVVVDKVLKRVEVSKIARKLQNRLALAQFKTKRGWEDLTLDIIEPKFEEEIRRKRVGDGDVLSDSSSSTSDYPYPTKTLRSSPLKAPLFSDAVGSSNGSTGRRKRTFLTSLDDNALSPSKRLRSSPTGHKSISGQSWKGNHKLAQSSPIKPRRQQHFTTSNGPDVSLFQNSQNLLPDLMSPNLGVLSDEDDDLLPNHSFPANNLRSSPPTTPPMRSRMLPDRQMVANKQPHGEKSGEEGADLLLYLAASPSPAMPTTRTRMDPPSTPPSKTSRDFGLPSSHMTTPGGGNLFPQTPCQGFDFADFVNITPSPAQKPWKTPGSISGAKTPLSITRRSLTFDDATL